MGSRHKVVLVVGVACVLTVVPVQSANGQSAHKPCDLVTDAQVSSAVGAKVKTGEPIGMTGCQWSTPDDPKTKTGRVMGTLSVWDEKWFPKGSTPGLSKKAVSGVGDDAVFDTLGDLTSLFVKKGKSTLQFRVYGLHDTTKQEDIEMSVAKDVLARW